VLSSQARHQKDGIAEMLWLILGVVLGAVVTFIGPPTIPQQFRSSITDNAIRGVGLLIVIVSTLLTSFVIVPDGHLGLLFRNYGGGSLREGRIVAVDGENGPQAEILAPGFHFRWLVNAIYTIDTNSTEVSIPADKVGVLIARDGAPLRPGQAFADPFPNDMGYRMLDAVTFMRNGGQHGPQLSVLTPGKYRLNRYLWDYSERPATELEAGFVGVVRSNVHADVDFGTLRASKLDTCDVLVNKDASIDAWRRRSFRSVAPVSGTNRCSQANTISIPMRLQSRRSIRGPSYGLSRVGINAPIFP
jgi:hypothetical protein